jgi:hypothetical protein
MKLGLVLIATTGVLFGSFLNAQTPEFPKRLNPYELKMLTSSTFEAERGCFNPDLTGIQIACEEGAAIGISITPKEIDKKQIQRVEFFSGLQVVVDGVKLSGVPFKTLASPDKSTKYSIGTDNTLQIVEIDRNAKKEFTVKDKQTLNQLRSFDEEVMIIQLNEIDFIVIVKGVVLNLQMTTPGYYDLIKINGEDFN